MRSHKLGNAVSEKMKRKLKSRAGESLGETLIALLIAVFALLMLAGAITTASTVVNRSKQKMNSYYSANESIIQLSGSGNDTSLYFSVSTETIDTSGSLNLALVPVTYYQNSIIEGKTVTAYKYKGTGGTSSTSGTSESGGG